MGTTLGNKNSIEASWAKPMAILAKGGVFSWKEASQTGISRRSFQRLLKENTIRQIRRGYYVHANSKIPAEHLDFTIACKHFGPNAIIGGLTALFHYGLTDSAPRHVWVLVPTDRRRAPALFRCIRTNIPANIGVVDRGSFRITSIERTIVDAFKFSTKIGLGTAVKAARTAVFEKQTTVAKISQQAEAMGLFKMIQKHWEAFTA